MSDEFTNESERRMQYRLAQFKKVGSAEKQRQRRADLTSALRKKKRDEAMLKRRRKGLTGGYSLNVGDSGAAHNDDTTNNVNANNSTALDMPPAATTTTTTTGMDQQEQRTEEEVNRLVQECITQFQNDEFRMQMLAMVYEDQDYEKQLAGVSFFRRVLSATDYGDAVGNANDNCDTDPQHMVIDAVISLNEGKLLERLAEMFCETQHQVIRYELAWLFTNVASGNSEHVRQLMVSGAVDALMQCLGSAQMDESVRDQCVWALGNVAGDSHPFRAYCFERNLIPILLLQLTNFTTQIPEGTTLGMLVKQCVEQSASNERLKELVRNTAWTVSNVCRKLDAEWDVDKRQDEMVPIDFQTAMPLLEAAATLVNHCDDQETVMHALYAIERVADSQEDDERIQAIVETGCLHHAALYMAHEDAKVHTPAMRLLGHVISSTDERMTTLVCELMVPDAVTQLLQSKRKIVRREMVWMLSNIAAGTPEQVQWLVDHSVLPYVVHMLLSDTYDIRREACHALSNAVCQCNEGQMQHIVSQEVCQGFVDVLRSKRSDVQLVRAALQGIEKILQTAENRMDYGRSLEMYKNMFYELGAGELLEDMQEHQSEEVYKIVIGILESYFDAGDDEEDEQALGTSNATGTFSFGNEPPQRTRQQDAIGSAVSSVISAVTQNSMAAQHSQTHAQYQDSMAQQANQFNSMWSMQQQQQQQQSHAQPMVNARQFSF